MGIIKEFRKQYKPFEFDYKITYEHPVTMATSNVFSNPSSTPEIIEYFLLKGCFKLSWTGRDRQKKPIACEGEIQIAFLRRVMSAVSQVMLLKGMDPTIVSVFYDMIMLEEKMIKRTKNSSAATA